MDPNPTFGIRAENRVILKDGNYRVWVTLLEQQFKSQKLWSHITNTAVQPQAARVVTTGVAVVAAGNGIAAVEAIAEITQEHVDSDNRKIEDFEAAIAKANYILLQHIEQKDVGALYGYDSRAAKWQKLKADYAQISMQMATEARARFFSFKWGSSENTLELQHRFGAAYAELEIQGVPETPETQARVLMTYPTERWR